MGFTEKLRRATGKEVSPVATYMQVETLTNGRQLESADLYENYLSLPTAEMIMALKESGQGLLRDVQTKQSEYAARVPVHGSRYVERVSPGATVNELSGEIMDMLIRSQAFLELMRGIEREYIELTGMRSSDEQLLSELRYQDSVARSRIMGEVAHVATQSQRAVEAEADKNERRNMEWNNFISYGDEGKDGLVQPALDRALETYREMLKHVSELNRNIREVEIHLQNVETRLVELRNRLGINIWHEYGVICAMHSAMVASIMQDALSQIEAGRELYQAVAVGVRPHTAPQGELPSVEEILGDVASSEKILEQPRRISIVGREKGATA